MRWIMLLAALGLVAFAGVASPAVPALACDGACTITGTSEGFLPPAVLVSSGTSVSWTSADTGHANADGIAGRGCFTNVSFTKLTPSAPIRLDISGGLLLGTIGSGSATPCAATQIADGTFALPYYCVIHPTMRGVLIVRA